MKKRFSKFIAFLIVFAMLLPMSASFAEPLVAKAATVSLNATSKTLQEGQTYQLKVNNLIETQKVTWKSNRSTVVKVSQSGKLTAVAAGSTTAIATVTDAVGKTVATLKCAVTVKTPEDGIALSAVSRTIGIGEKFQLSVTNLELEDVENLTWSANNPKVAKVDKNGLVTGVGTGSTEIRFKITYTDGTSKIYPCYVTVKKISPATDFKLSGLSFDDVLNVYVGKSATVKATKVPSNGSGTIEWTSKNPEVATVSEKGVITAKKTGITTITVTMGEVKKEFYVNVTVAPTPTPKPTATPKPTSTPTPTPTPVVVKEAKVTSVVMTASSEIKVTFDTPISKSSVITSDNQLVAGTIIIGKENGNTDLGLIKPALSEDGKTLTLSTAGRFQGTYSIVLSNKIKTTTGLALTQYSLIADWKDTVGPKYLGTDTDRSGFVSQIHFDEAIDISNLAIDVNSTIANTSLLYYVKTASNYKLSADRKTLLIDLSSVANGKSIEISVKVRGIRDLVGNSTANLQENITLKTDTTPLPLVDIEKVERVSKDKLKVTYSGPITSAGSMVLSSKIVNADPIDFTKEVCEAYFSIPTEYQALQDSVLLVTFRDWRSARSNSLGNKSVSVPFTLDTTPPTLKSYTLETSISNGIPTAKLILTYNKEVTVINPVQSFLVTAYETNGYVNSNTFTSTNAFSFGKQVTYIFNDSRLFVDATFAFTVPSGSVKDTMDNQNKMETCSMKRTVVSSTELPGPTSVTQDSLLPNVIMLTFANRVDTTTAQNINNYYIADGNNKYYPISAEIYSQNEQGAVVKLTFATSVFAGSTANYEIVINGVKGYNDSFSAITNFHKVFSASDTNAPTIVSATYHAVGIVTVEVSQPVTGSMHIVLSDDQNREIVGYTSSQVSGQNKFLVVLDKVAEANATNLKMRIIACDMVDAKGARLTASNTVYPVTKAQ